MNDDCLRICYFGIKDSNYPRQRTISSYFTAKGVNVDRVEIDASRGFASNFFSLMKYATKSRKRYDVVILAEFSLQFAMIAHMLAKKSGGLLVVDWFVGLYETRVEDYRSHAKYSLKAFAFYVADLFAARVADIVITDTRVRGLMIYRRFRLRQMPITVPVGAPSWAQFEQGAPGHSNRQLKVLYYGNYIPLHGLDKFIEGAVLASEDISIQVTLLGDGALRKEIETLVLRLDAEKQALFDFRGPVDEQNLHAVICSHDVILGVFGSSPKASSVVANKVWQGLASGRTVLTQTSEALAPYRDLFPRLLLESEPTAEAICTSLVSYYTSPEVDETLRRTAAASIAGLVEQGLGELLEKIQSPNVSRQRRIFGRRQRV